MLTSEYNSPVFVLTSDVDWASEDCLQDFFGILDRFGVKPVMMATHRSAAISRRAAEGRIELGLHPNFLPGSTHGATVADVVRHMFDLFPDATTFRSHSFVDSSPIAAAMAGRGLRYDSNLCLYLQPNLVPLRHQSGLVRFPVFWEDDVHAAHGGSWRVDDVIERFLEPGLKVLNVHPLWVSLNISDTAYYDRHKGDSQALSTADLARLRREGDGARTFLVELLRRLTELGHRFSTLGDLHRLASSLPRGDAGRENVVSDAEYECYWKGSAADRQALLKDLYNQRDALDPYATSRDFNARELEIEAIRRALPPAGHVIDLGCGNGYTAISLARGNERHTFTGIDFADRLIDGACRLAASERPPLARPPEFICGDAVAYLSQCATGSADAVITERFLLNLPGRDVQRAVIADCFRVLRPGGRLLMCEASDDAFNALNRLRVATGLPAIPGTSTDNVSAMRFDDAEVEGFAREVGFRLADKLGFSSYFVISRVLHPLLVSPLSPRFGAPINRLARIIQSHLPFAPGFGSNVLWVLEKP